MSNEYSDELSRDSTDKADESRRITDGREALGESFSDPTFADRQSVGRAFEDPNSMDDTKLGKSFEETNSSAKKHHRPVKDVVTEPFRKPASRRIFFWVAVGIILLFLIIFVVGWIPRHNQEKESQKEAQHEKQDPEVEVIRVARAKDSGGLVVPGTTTPLTEASVYARANGYLKRRFVDIGDHVHKGQLLAVIDAPDLDEQVDQARQQVRQSQAQLDQQRTQLALTRLTNDRYQALVARGVFSRQEGAQRQADFQAQEANVAAAARNVEAFKANLRRVVALQSYERVTAPFDGVITQRNVDTGALISASGSAGSAAPTPLPSGQTSSSQAQNAATNNGGSSGAASSLATPSNGGAQGGALFTIAQSSRLRILVSVPEGYAELVKPGFHTTLHFQEFPNRVFYGDVSRNSGSIDQNTRTLLTEIQVDNTSAQLLPGMYAVVTFAPQHGQGPLVVSGDAIAIRKDQPTVAVIRDGRIKLTPVLIGRDYGPEVEIVGGLHEGDLISSTFTDDIREGVKVRTRMNKQGADNARQQPASDKPTPPGGSTQYGDPGITDQDMQGQNAKPQQKQSNGGEKKAADRTGGKQ